MHFLLKERQAVWFIAEQAADVGCALYVKPLLALAYGTFTTDEGLNEGLHSFLSSFHSAYAQVYSKIIGLFLEKWLVWSPANQGFWPQVLGLTLGVLLVPQLLAKSETSLIGSHISSYMNLGIWAGNIATGVSLICSDSFTMAALHKAPLNAAIGGLTGVGVALVFDLFPKAYSILQWALDKNNHKLSPENRANSSTANKTLHREEEMSHLYFTEEFDLPGKMDFYSMDYV